MIDPANVPEVASEELLARFVLQSSHVRSSNQTVKADAFMPHPYQDLSVTRHLAATNDEIWAAGRSVAAQIPKTLYGRADVFASECLSRNLVVLAAPVSENPNHADITGWPAEKSEQKALALEIAAAAKFVPSPPPS